MRTDFVLDECGMPYEKPVAAKPAPASALPSRGRVPSASNRSALLARKDRDRPDQADDNDDDEGDDENGNAHASRRPPASPTAPHARLTSWAPCRPASPPSSSD